MWSRRPRVRVPSLTLFVPASNDLLSDGRSSTGQTRGKFGAAKPFASRLCGHVDRAVEPMSVGGLRYAWDRYPGGSSRHAGVRNLGRSNGRRTTTGRYVGRPVGCPPEVEMARRSARGGLAVGTPPGDGGSVNALVGRRLEPSSEQSRGDVSDAQVATEPAGAGRPGDHGHLYGRGRSLRGAARGDRERRRSCRYPDHGGDEGGEEFAVESGEHRNGERFRCVGHFAGRWLDLAASILGGR